MSKSGNNCKSFSAYLIKSGKMHPTKGLRKVGFNKTKDEKIVRAREFQNKFWAKVGVHITD